MSQLKRALVSSAAVAMGLLVFPQTASSQGIQMPAGLAAQLGGGGIGGIGAYGGVGIGYLLY